MEQLVARRAHNPKVTGSSPVPATTKDTGNGILFFVFYLSIKAFKKMIPIFLYFHLFYSNTLILYTKPTLGLS